jgi:predicted deacylase
LLLLNAYKADHYSSSAELKTPDAIATEDHSGSRATPEPTITFFPTFTPIPTQTTFVLPDPELNGPTTIGWSVAGRRIEVYRFGTGAAQRLIVGGIHGGGEWNTTSLANSLIEYIKSHPEVIPKSVSLYILPVLNPDGAARSEGDSGRTNEHGVDLNRNWDTNWQADWPRAGCWNQLPTTGGSKAMSEPETIALAAFIKTHHFDAIISYHSAGLGIFAGGTPPTKESISLARAISAVTPYSYPPINTGCVYTGAFVDWAANQGIAALDVELSDHTDTDFNINLKVLKVFLAWK